MTLRSRKGTLLTSFRHLLVPSDQVRLCERAETGTRCGQTVDRKLQQAQTQRVSAVLLQKADVNSNGVQLKACNVDK